MRRDGASYAGIAWAALCWAVIVPQASASDMAAIGAGTLLLTAWGVLAALNLLVTVVVVVRRVGRQSPGARWYLLVPVETWLLTILAVFVAGSRLVDMFFLFAVPVPLAAWALAHRLHREREPEFRYRHTRYRGRR